MKERNKIYPLHEMLPGERFYFARDREIKKQAGYNVKYANCRKGSASIFSNEQFKANSHSVIYLRNQ
jgi:hypothetical protein